MQTSCCYALQDKAWVNDPDGNEWEVFTVLKDDLQETAGKVGGDAVCCAPVSNEEALKTTDATCGCETAPPAEGEGACCQTQAEKFGIEIANNESGEACCTPTFVTADGKEEAVPTPCC